MRVEQRGDIIALVYDIGGDNERVALLEITDAQQLVIDLDAVLPTVTHEEATAMFDARLDVAEITSGRTCSLGCNQPITDRETYTEVRGYTRTQRKGGGANQVALRQPTGRIAHAKCIEDAKKGGHGQQAAF